MSQESSKIAYWIRKIAEQAIPVWTGKVVSADAGTLTCTVQLTQSEEGVETEGVTLNVQLNNTAGCYAIPEEDADCIVLVVDGQLELLKASSYEKVYIQAADKITMNDGAYSGLVKVVPLTEKLNNLENDVNDLKSCLNSLLAAATAAATPPTGSPSTPVTAGTLATLFNGVFTAYAGHVLVPTLQDDLENRAIIHG